MKTKRLAKIGVPKNIALITKLMKSRKFVKKLKDEGYQFDLNTIFNAFSTAAGWKLKMPITRKMTKKEQKQFLKSKEAA